MRNFMHQSTYPLMKRIIYIMLLSFVLFCTVSAQAEDSIKVLMLETPYDSLPAEDAKVMNSVSGRVFLNGRYYEGDLNILSDNKGIYVVKTLPFNQYLEGVVASESGNDWELEALKAQSIVSRTYAMFFKTLNAGKNYHITSSVNDQLYKGNNSDSKISRAVKNTENEILTHKHAPIKAFFHATCEGKTELPEEIWDESYPYIRSVDCRNKNAPYENWKRRFSLEIIGRAMGMKELKDIVIDSYTSTGRAKTIKFILSDESSPSVTVKAIDFRKTLGYKEVPSTLFTVSVKNDVLLLRGKGYGHGVGLSQWGALEMARQGKGYKEILSHYYPGAILEHSETLYSRKKEDND